MRTVELIVEQEGYTLKEIEICLDKGICNGCGPKGFNIFDKIVYKIKYIDWTKYGQLIRDMNLVCCLHDLAYQKGGNFLDFIKSNYILGLNMMRLFHRTNITRRFVIFSLFFITTTLLGWKYFNWG